MGRETTGLHRAQPFRGRGKTTLGERARCTLCTVLPSAFKLPRSPAPCPVAATGDATGECRRSIAQAPHKQVPRRNLDSALLNREGYLAQQYARKVAFSINKHMPTMLEARLASLCCGHASFAGTGFYPCAICRHGVAQMPCAICRHGVLSRSQDQWFVSASFLRSNKRNTCPICLSELIQRPRTCLPMCSHTGNRCLPKRTKGPHARHRPLLTCVCARIHTYSTHTDIPVGYTSINIEAMSPQQHALP
jgi:hypothetical protein